jgi:hypothetical protein
MGAWGLGAFENDAARDWLAMAKRDGPADADALRSAIGMSYLDVDEGSSTVAAATLVAAVLDGNAADLPDDARAVLRGWHPAPELRQLALGALDAACGRRSELASLWREGTDAPAWHAGVERLRRRLVAANASD